MEKGKFKFHYFPLNARGAITRAILSAVRADWEDKVVSFQEWPTLKNSGLCEFKQLPVLEHGDKKLTQSMAIELYLARLFGIYGKNVEDEYQIDSLLCTFEDLFSVVHDIVFPRNEEDKKNVDKFMTQLVQKYTFYLQQIEKRYIAHGKKNYFLGDYFSLADIYLTVMCKSFCKVMKDKCPTKTAAPAIFELINRIQDNELKTFFDKHFVKEGSC